MAKLTLILGVLLVLVGLGSFGVSDSAKPGTALIPAYIGSGFIVLGALLLPNIKLLRIIIAHLALLLAALLPLPIILRWVGGNFGTQLATAAQIATIILLWSYVAFGVRSFIVARKMRKEGSGFEVV